MEPAPSFGSGRHSLFLRFGLKLYLFIYFKLRVRVGYGDSTSHDGLNTSPFLSFCPPYMMLSCSNVALKAIFATTTYTNVVFNIRAFPYIHVHTWMDGHFRIQHLAQE